MYEKGIPPCATIKSTKTNWKRVFSMSQDQFTRIFLQIKDQNIKNLAVKESSDGVLRVTADLSYAITLWSSRSNP